MAIEVPFRRSFWSDRAAIEKPKDSRSTGLNGDGRKV